MAKERIFSGSCQSTSSETKSGQTTSVTFCASHRRQELNPGSLSWLRINRWRPSLMTGGAGLRRLNDRVLDFGHARIAVLRDVALPINFAVWFGDRVAMRLDPRPRCDVSLFGGFVTALMDDAGDDGVG